MRPRRVAFSDHAAERAARYAIPATEVADLVVEEHPRCRANPGAADWQVRRGGLVVVYDCPICGPHGSGVVLGG